MGANEFQEWIAYFSEASQEQEVGEMTPDQIAAAFGASR